MRRLRLGDLEIQPSAVGMEIPMSLQILRAKACSASENGSPRHGCSESHLRMVETGVPVAREIAVGPILSSLHIPTTRSIPAWAGIPRILSRWTSEAV